MSSLTLMKRRIQGQKFEGQDYTKLDLSSMLAFGSSWIDCNFASCDLSLADLRNSVFESCRFFDCDLPIANFSGGSQLRHVVFEGCRMKQSIFSGVHPFVDVAFQDCELHYSTFADSTVREIWFVDSNLHGADLRFVECGKAVFQRCVLWNASVQFGCQFFGTQNSFDERSADLFAGMLGRLHPREEARTLLAGIAGGEMRVVERLMASQEKE